MNQPSSRRLEFDRENTLYELFNSSNDLSIIDENRFSQTNDIAWITAFGRYLKTIRINSHSISSSPHLYEFIKHVLNANLIVSHGLFLILKQCVYLYPNKLVNLSFQRHLSNVQSSLVDPYLKYKYVRLLRLIINEVDKRFLSEVLPLTNRLLENYHQLDISIIIVLEKLVLINCDSELQLSINQSYHQTFIEYLKSNDFDDDEVIDLCYLLFQVNLHETLHCPFHITNIFIDLIKYIDYDVETMINWLLTPETGETFLLFILQLIKYLSPNRNELKSQAGDNIYNQLIVTMNRFYDQLKTAHEKSLFPYNIKPLLNAFKLF